MSGPCDQRFWTGSTLGVYTTHTDEDSDINPEIIGTFTGWTKEDGRTFECYVDDAWFAHLPDDVFRRKWHWLGVQDWPQVWKGEDGSLFYPQLEDRASIALIGERVPEKIYAPSIRRLAKRFAARGSPVRSNCEFFIDKEIIEEGFGETYTYMWPSHADATEGFAHENARYLHYSLSRNVGHMDRTQTEE